jgi:uncharacterized membrane protein YfcA
MDPFLSTIIYLFAGMLCGFVNVLASSGYTITLPLMVLMGVPPQIANATNRLPILTGSMMAVYNFNKAKMINWTLASRVTIPVVLGAITGVVIASMLPDAIIGYIITIAVIAAMILIITNIRKLLYKKTIETPSINWKHYIVFYFIGLWAGLIVLDAASLLLLGLVLGVGIDLLPANAIKNVLLLVISFISVVIFGFEHEINWLIGLTLSVGSVAGSNIASKFAMKDRSKVWIVRILLIIMVVEAIQLIFKFRLPEIVEALITGR